MDFGHCKENVNQIEILKFEILCNILHTAEHFIKLVVGEKHFELECQLSFDTFRVMKFSFIEFHPKFEKIRKTTAF